MFCLFQIVGVRYLLLESTLNMCIREEHLPQRYLQHSNKEYRYRCPMVDIALAAGLLDT